MELHTIRYFVEIAKRSSISAASEVMHVTQPTLSRQMKQLEEELGTALFCRTKNKLSLTAAGALFLQHCEEILRTTDKAVRDVKMSDDNVVGGVSIGLMGDISELYLAEILRGFCVLYPKVTFELFNGDSGLVSENIKSNKLDLGFSVEPIDRFQFNSIPLEDEEPWGLIMADSNKLSSLESIKPSDLQGQMLLIPNVKESANKVMNWIGPNNANIRFFGHFNLIANTMNLTRNGTACTVAMHSAYNAFNKSGLTFKPFSPSLRTRYSLIWSKHNTISNQANVLLDYIKTNFFFDGALRIDR